MNGKDFNNLVADICADTQKTLSGKAQEYATNESRFHNFEVAGKMLGMDRKEALWGMAAKHLVSVQDMVYAHRNGTFNPEYIREKCGDLRNYLILLEGMLVEDYDKEKV